MSKGINKVILIGNLGADPEKSGSATKLRLATSESYIDRNGAKVERTEWHKITIFGKLGDIAMQYLRKGSKVFIEGSLRTSKYNDKDGQQRYSTEILANFMQMLDGKSEGNFEHSYQPTNANNPAQTGVMNQSVETFMAFDDEDDLPF